MTVARTNPPSTLSMMGFSRLKKKKKMDKRETGRKREKKKEEKKCQRSEKLFASSLTFSAFSATVIN
jgi:hypothetical protein